MALEEIEIDRSTFPALGGPIYGRSRIQRYGPSIRSPRHFIQRREDGRSEKRERIAGTIEVGVGKCVHRRAGKGSPRGGSVEHQSSF